MDMSKNSSRFFGLRHRRSPSNLQPTSVSKQEPSYEPQIPRGPRTDVKMTSVNEQTAELFKTTNHVLVQIAETKRLRDLKAARLAPSERQWIDSTIEDTASAAHEVSIFLEPTRVEQQTSSGRLSLSRQLKWKYRDNQRAQEKKNHLLVCHNSLMTVLAHLQRLNHLETTTSSSSVTHELVGNLNELDITSTTSASSIHELGGTTPTQMNKFDKFDPFDAGHRQRSDSEFTKFSDEKIEHKAPVNLTFQGTELNDLFAWRRSKGTALTSASAVDIKPSM